MGRPLEAKNISQLLMLAVEAEQINDESLKREVTGTLALLVGTIIRKKDAEAFRASWREIAQFCETSGAKWILKAAAQGLSPDELEWMQAQIQHIMSGVEDE
jgi:hypothetical protein